MRKLHFFAAVRLWSTNLNANLVCYKGHNYPVWDVQVEILSSEIDFLCIYLSLAYKKCPINVFLTGSGSNFGCSFIFLQLFVIHAFELLICSLLAVWFNVLVFNVKPSYFALNLVISSAFFLFIPFSFTFYEFLEPFNQSWFSYSLMLYNMCPVLLVQFSPVGHYFASASHDRTARIWSMDRIQPLRIMAGHLSDVDVSLSLSLSLCDLFVFFFFFCCNSPVWSVTCILSDVSLCQMLREISAATYLKP